jgi:60 kDa SS-A/Ro ribonucleoprotein
MLKCTASLEKLGGKTALLVDHSHSMDSPVSAKSEVTRFEAAAALSMILRETTERCRVFTFANKCVEIPPRKGFAMLEAIRSVRDPVSTMLGAAVKHVYRVFPECNRIIVVTDEQSADRPPHPQGTGYIVNVAGNKNGIAYGPWVSIDGWSEAILDYIRESETDA